MDINNIIKLVEGTVVTVGLQVMGALALYIIGRWLFTFAVGLVQKALAPEPGLMPQAQASLAASRCTLQTEPVAAKQPEPAAPAPAPKGKR